MSARHLLPKELEGLSLEDIGRTYIKRWIDTEADWDAYVDARVDGFRRARHGVIGAGASNKHSNNPAIPPRGFTMAIMFVEPGQGNAAHTHETEEVFFVLKGELAVFIENEKGDKIWYRLGQWDTIACPPGVIHGYLNKSHEPVYIQIMLGKGAPETMGYADPALFEARNDHLNATDKKRVEKIIATESKS